MLSITKNSIYKINMHKLILIFRSKCPCNKVRKGRPLIFNCPIADQFMTSYL